MEDDSKEKFKIKDKYEEEKTEDVKAEIAVMKEVDDSFENGEHTENDKMEEKAMEEIKGHQLKFNKPLIMSADKAVSTYGIPDLVDYQRAVTYEIVFNSLLEKKMQAMKRDVEERKRAKRLKRKSIGRIFFAKRLFSSVDSRKSSSFSETGIKAVQARSEPSTPQKTTTKRVTKTANVLMQQRSKSQDIEVETISLKSSSQRPFKARTRSKSKSNTASSESPKQTTTSQNDDSVTSTLSNSSDKAVKHSVLVQAQTHIPTEVQIVSSSSGDSKYAPALSNNNHTSSAPAPLSMERTHDTSSLASGYENGTIGRLHSSTMAEDSLTSIRDSIESLSFNSSRCTVSFGATEVIPQELDVNLYERIKAAKRQRVLEAKSISAQCSPILPLRHVIKTMVHAPMSPPLVQLIKHPAVSIVESITTSVTATATMTTTTTTTTTTAISPKSGAAAFTTHPRFVPNQLSYTDSIFESRNISRQNTSEDSANLTVSTLLNQSDSLSLYAPVQGFPTSDMQFAGKPVAFNDRFKSKSTSLLVALGNGRTRPPPLPPPPFETAQHSPIARQSPTTLIPHDLPLEQLQQLRITSNMRYNEYHYRQPQQQQPRNLEECVRTTFRPPISYSSTSTTTTTTATSSEATTKAKVKTAIKTTSSPSSSPPQSLHIVTVTTSSNLPHQYPVNDTTATTITMDATVPAPQLPPPPPPFYLSTSSTTIRNNILVNGAIVASSSVASDTAKLHRMTSTSTGSSIGPTGCCTTTKSSSRIKEKQRFKPSVAMGQSGSDDEYRKKKRKYKRYHRCSDPVLVYPTPSGLQHCILSMPPNDPIPYPYTENYAYNMQLQMESDKSDDLEKIVPSDSTKRRHHKHRHHRHKKRHRHKKPKILVHDLETQEVKVIDPDDLPQRARWTIIATACLLLLMCLMLVGITLRMAPIIDDMEFEKKCKYLHFTIQLIS